MKDLSILIPSRNEEFVNETVIDALKNIEADTEIIVVFDGAPPERPLPKDKRIHTVFLNDSIGQRAATNLACRMARGKYVMKLDAHCSFDKGFDRKMLEGFEKVGDEVAMIPVMRNLWAFDWKCMTCGKKWYQGPTPTRCKETNYKGTGKPCDGTVFTKKIVWQGKPSPQSVSYCFDSEPHFQYFNEYKSRDKYRNDLKTGFTETMSLQGSCFMLTKDNYWKWDVCDEKAGSWGNQGLEVACAIWLSGGRCLVNHNTWYAHMFRTQGGDFGFPYEQKGNTVEKTKKYIKDKFWKMEHPTQIHSIKWLLEKFWPVKGWSDKDVEKL